MFLLCLQKNAYEERWTSAGRMGAHCPSSEILLAGMSAAGVHSEISGRRRIQPYGVSTQTDVCGRHFEGFCKMSGGTCM